MSDKKTILLTGASGFIGQRYTEYNKDRYNIRTLSLRTTKVADIDFSGIDTIVHLAGMAHQMQKIDDQIYFDVNFTLTKELAQAAKAAGVKHFIFMSTIKVFGEHQNTLLKVDSPCKPIDDPYGQSKLDAEEFLKTIDDKDFIVSTVRPPLVYGPRVKGNLIRFLKLGDTSFPLPFKNVSNRRTMVYLDNLIELCNHLTDHPKSGIFLAGDRQPISTEQLIASIRKNMGKSPNLFQMPGILKYFLEKLRPELAIRLYGSLEMDTKQTNKVLDFEPPYSIDEGIKVMTDWYNSEEKS